MKTCPHTKYSTNPSRIQLAKPESEKHNFSTEYCFILGWGWGPLPAEPSTRSCSIRATSLGETALPQVLLPILAKQQLCWAPSLLPRRSVVALLRENRETPEAHSDSPTVLPTGFKGPQEGGSRCCVRPTRAGGFVDAGRRFFLFSNPGNARIIFARYCRRSLATKPGDRSGASAGSSAPAVTVLITPNARRHPLSQQR